MALTKLSTKAVGSVVYLQETADTRAAYTVGMHGYNGVGTLLVRQQSLGERKFDYSYGAIEWSRSDLYEWMNETWVSSLPAATRALLLTTSYGKAFIPSRDELWFGASGNALPTAAKSTILSCITGYTWLRDVYSSYDEETESWTDDGIYYAYSYASHNGTNYSTSWQSATYTAAVMACVCVDGELAVDDEGLVRTNVAPKLECEYSNEEDIGARSSPFHFYYKVTDSDGDSVTVTETVGTTVVKTHVPTLGQEQYFTISRTLYDALEDDQYYDLVISATDGYGTTIIRLRFLKSAQVGYRVYAGQIDTKVNGTSVAAGSYVFGEKVCIFDPRWPDESRMIFEPTLTMEKNNFGSLEFTMPKENAYYDKIALRKTVLSVEENGVTLWNGYVLELSRNFKMDKVVYARGEMGYLQDIACSVTSKEWKAGDLFTNIVQQTNKSGIKAFRVGQIDEALLEEEVDTTDSGTQYTTVWGALNDILLNETGGIIRLRLRRDKTASYGVGYTRYLDYLVDVPDKTSQTIEFGRNLLDLNYYMSGYDIVNRLKVYGYETKGWWFWKKTSPIVETVSDTESIALYGVVERSVFVDGKKSTRAELQRVGKKKLKEMSAGLAGGIEISALDLQDVGVDVNRLGFMKKARILSARHGIDQWELCSKLEIPLDDPAGKNFTFGETVDSISALQAEQSSAARRALNGMESIVSYINGTS